MGKRPKDGKPSVYATNLAGLLSGDKECKYATWFKSRYWYDKIEDTTFDRAGWTSDHGAMVTAERDRLVQAGWTVTLESANKFDLAGRVGSIAGKPDIEAFKMDAGMITDYAVIDCKTGRRKNADWWQVLLYLYAKLKVRPELRPVVSGQVLYRDARIPVYVHDLTEERVAQLGRMMQEVCDGKAPSCAPSQRECNYCDISADHCHGRYNAPQAPTMVSDF